MLNEILKIKFSGKRIYATASVKYLVLMFKIMVSLIALSFYRKKALRVMNFEP